MGIGAIGGYSAYNSSYAMGMQNGAIAAGSASAAEGAGKAILNPGESTKANPGKRVSPADMNNGKVLQASVSIRTAVCPECGRTYVAGGETCTKIAYSNEENPYVQARKGLNKQGLLGANVDMAG